VFGVQLYQGGVPRQGLIWEIGNSSKVRFFKWINNAPLVSDPTSVNCSEGLENPTVSQFITPLRDWDAHYLIS